MSRLLINEPPLQVLPSLAVKVGLQEAIVLQQIHYWVQMAKPKSGECWVYNTYEQWAIQFPFWSSEAIRKIFKNLREKGLVLSRPRGLHAFDRVNEYTIDYERLGLLDAEKFTASSVTAVPDHAEKFTASGRTNLPPLYTETTAETTAEKSARKRADPAKAAPKKLTSQDLKTEGVDESYAEAWLSMRKDKRLPLTEGAWQITKEEGAKCGLDPAATVRECLSRGWAAFRADWYSDRPSRSGDLRPAAPPMFAGVI